MLPLTSTEFHPRRSGRPSSSGHFLYQQTAYGYTSAPNVIVPIYRADGSASFYL